MVDSVPDWRAAMEPRFEILPFGKGIEQSLEIGEKLHLTVTTSPKHGVDHSVEVAERLRGVGHTVTLHVAARMVRGEDHLTEILERTRGCGIDDLFVIGGDAEEPLGPFTAAGELLDVLVEHPLRPATIGIGGYPEGHPLIAPDVLEAALAEKAKVADYVVTQLCFDVRVLRSWLDGVRARGIQQPVLIGAVGTRRAAPAPRDRRAHRRRSVAPLPPEAARAHAALPPARPLGDEVLRRSRALRR